MRTSLEEKILLSLWGDKSEEIYEIVREQEKRFRSIIIHEHPDELAASMDIRYVTRKLQKLSDKWGLNIYLSGRDCWLYHVQLRKWGVKHEFNPTLNRLNTVFAKPEGLKPIGNVIFFDTGFAGSIYYKLLTRNLIGDQSKLLLHAHQDAAHWCQLGKGGKLAKQTRDLVMKIEHKPLPWAFPFSSVQNVSSPKELKMVNEMKAQVRDEGKLARRYTSNTSLPQVLRQLRLQLLA